MALQVREEDAGQLQRIIDGVRELSAKRSAQKSSVEPGVVRQQWTSARELQKLVHDLIHGFRRLKVQWSDPRQCGDELRKASAFLQAAELLKTADLLAATHLHGANLDYLIQGLIEACRFQVEEH